MNRPVVVFGASGFLGTSVMTALHAAGVPAIGLTRGRKPGLLSVPDYACFDPPPGAVAVHLAETANLAAVHGQGDRHGETSLALCRALLAKPWAGFVYASSALVYGDRATAPRRTAEAVAPDTVYGRAKLACEGTVLAAGGRVLRFANLFGPGMPTGTIIPDILRQLSASGPLKMRKSAPVRDFLWVEDAARLVLAATRPTTGQAAGQAEVSLFNAGSGVGTSAGDLTAILLELAGQTGRPIEADESGEGSHLVLDIAATMTAFDWRPHVDLRDGLRTLIRGTA